MAARLQPGPGPACRSHTCHQTQQDVPSPSAFEVNDRAHQPAAVDPAGARDARSPLRESTRDHPPRSAAGLASFDVVRHAVTAAPTDAFLFVNGGVCMHARPHPMSPSSRRRLDIHSPLAPASTMPWCARRLAATYQKRRSTARARGLTRAGFGFDIDRRAITRRFCSRKKKPPPWAGVSG